MSGRRCCYAVAIRPRRPNLQVPHMEGEGASAAGRYCSQHRSGATSKQPSSSSPSTSSRSNAPDGVPTRRLLPRSRRHLTLSTIKASRRILCSKPASRKHSRDTVTSHRFIPRPLLMRYTHYGTPPSLMNRNCFLKSYPSLIIN